MVMTTLSRTATLSGNKWKRQGMKLTWKQIEPFLKKPDPKARVVLIYGPDDGLMRERAKIIGKSVVPDLDDPFNVVTLNSDILNEDPARLSDEANALSMMGGARLIRIEGGADKITPTIKDYLDNPSDENLVVIQAGELGPRSSLRLLCEKAKNAAALPCYVEDERDISNLIREMLTSAGYRIDSDAQIWLSGNIAGDRARSRAEIEKLILYMASSDNKTVRLEDVQACCGDTGTTSLDDLVYAVGGNQPEAAMAAYHRLLGEGVAEVVILRTLQNHFRRLHYTNAMIAQGKSAQEAVKSLQPPIFFKVEPAFRAQVSKWKGKKLDTVLSKLSELEAQTKTTGAPVETLCAQAILSLSVMR
jgi:DNA polymerase-3 subunit delta